MEKKGGEEDYSHFICCGTSSFLHIQMGPKGFGILILYFLIYIIVLSFGEFLQVKEGSFGHLFHG